MHKYWQKFSSFAYKRFTLLWIVVSAFFLLTALYLNWQYSYSANQQKIAQEAEFLSNNVDSFIEDIFQDVYSLPLSTKNLPECVPELQEEMERITLNSPEISGIVLSNNQHQQLCSTLHTAEHFDILTHNKRVILGPYSVSVFDQPVYMIQKKIGPHYIGLLIVANMFKTSALPS